MNSTLIQFFHWYLPGDSFLWEHVAEQAPYLAELGITSAWLPPAQKGAAGASSTGYDPYDLFDLGEFDQKGSIPTKYGTRDQLVNACQVLAQNGIGAIVDIVLNHRAGGDALESFQVVSVDPEDRNVTLAEPHEIQSYTKFTFPGRGTQYSDFEWNFSCFTGVDYADGVEEAGIYRIINEYGDSWDEVLGDEKGNYDYLMFCDVETRSPHVREELHHWGQWLHETLGFTGVRLDAVKHMSPAFFKDWVQTLRTNTGQDIFAVGEYWAPADLDLLQKYLQITEGCMSLFDCTLQETLHLASESGEEFDLRTILDRSLMTANPVLAVTLVANHDTQPLQSLEAPVQPWFKPLAYALILLRAEGYPCVFYPDLYGAQYRDQGKDGEEYEIEMPKVEGLETLLKLRRQNAYGEQESYFDEPHCIAFARLGDEEHDGCAVILSNQDEGSKSITMGSRYRETSFRDAMGYHSEELVLDADGQAVFHCLPGSVSVWVPCEPTMTKG